MNFDRSIFIGKFTQEAKELIQKLNTDLIRLEKDPQNHYIIKDILRIVHTLKGSSKIMRFQNVSTLSHKIEDLLISVQDAQIALSGDIIELLFRSTDFVSQSIEAILKEAEDSVDIAEICTVLDDAANGGEISSQVSQLDAKREKIPFSDDVLHNKKERELIREADLKSSPQILPNATHESQTQTSFTEGSPLFQETIRVNVEKLDDAIRLVGEIAVSHRKSERLLSTLKELQRLTRKHVKQIHQLCHGNHVPTIPKAIEAELLKNSLHLLKGIERTFKQNRDETATMELVISELYDDVLKMRMLPLSEVFDTFPRAVRDMGKYFKKKIELCVTGEDTTLDRKIIEKLNTPLIHILRNCIDHGIESPEEREAQGKPETGLITIEAYHKSGHIKIEIADDGRGVQIEKLKQRAIQRGILSEEKVQTLKESELLNLAFFPRLSTSDMITDISGRGVGMDIIKASIEQLKGSVTLSSKPGKGTACILTLPMTLTSIRSFIILSQKQLFAVPISSIEETLQVSSDEFIQIVDHPAIRIRNQIIYVVDLADVLGLRKEHPRLQDNYFVLIARANGKRVGLIVDEILDEQDVVVKQLPAHMQKAKIIAGATISSDNTIILILHIPEIVNVVKHVTREHQETQPIQEEKVPPRILVVDDSINTGEIEQRILQACGYEVDLAKNGVEALEQVQNSSYNLIVTDIEMPMMDGFTLTEKLRDIPEYANVPIVIVTSLERETDKKRGFQVGANAYILKGNFEQRSLIEAVESLI